MSPPKAIQWKPEDVFLIKGVQNDQPLWYYVAVDKIKQPLVRKLSEASREELEKLGEILFWGLGDEPPLYYREKVKKGDFTA